MNTEFSVLDLFTIKEIIDIAAQRGAFRANELTKVGTLYDRLTQFLDNQVALAEAQANANSESQPQGE